MGSKAGKTGVDLWSEIAESDEQQKQTKFEVIYRRRRPQQTHKDVVLNPVGSSDANRLSLAAAAAANIDKKRISWNRSLSTRGRTSIAVGACIGIRPQQKQPRRKGKPVLPKGKVVQPASFEKEREYFEEVDAFELLEESPSPKRFGTWTMGNQSDSATIPNLCSRLEKWLISKKLNYSCGPSSTLSKILETPSMNLEPIQGNDLDASSLRTPEKSSLKITSGCHPIQSRSDKDIANKDVPQRDYISQSNESLVSVKEESCEDIEAAVKKLSLAPTSASFDLDHVNPFATLLAVCGQSAPAKLLDVLSKNCDPDSIAKIGEGTYGEAFKAGNTVCKIVPIDGDLKVNGEVQKRSEELLEEVVLSRTLNLLKRNEDDAHNACTTFIDTLEIHNSERAGGLGHDQVQIVKRDIGFTLDLDLNLPWTNVPDANRKQACILKVCQGPYDDVLIKAWEDWDDKHGSENDHPKQFPENQCYVVFVLQHGGKDLESFVLLNFDEARSLLVQVTAALAVAEAAYEFEHRDLHWGNILLTRNDSVTLHFILEGKHMSVRTFGLLISIIDFTLSRINTGEREDILFLDLSSDPYLFKGPKGDKQSETYRKMKEVTEDYWEGSFPRTNVLWLIYLVDTLLVKKSFARSSKNERDLRSLKKRLDKYQSTKEAIFDPFFSDLVVDDTIVKER
ncbi:hypothetical protein JRO89_XS04G0010400 [Xanthoceras sorbifolium]|uniref:non-specific serine/threonine protein kinase n=1 Tax=Xanthoceras sorbifolium TaxID=99658 RepID=A0ABQ8I486_9ROSI|nr:hypothetical protein JRO89_XS04G0010400 [Xanthoceras sorbifolium]